MDSKKRIFRVSFRSCNASDMPLCDNCESQPSAWYNDLLANGQCEDCMEQVQEDYKKNGGA